MSLFLLVDPWKNVRVVSPALQKSESVTWPFTDPIRTSYSGEILPQTTEHLNICFILNFEPQYFYHCGIGEITSCQSSWMTLSNRCTIALCSTPLTNKKITMNSNLLMERASIFMYILFASEDRGMERKQTKTLTQNTAFRDGWPCS